MSALDQDMTLAIAALTDAANRTYEAPDGSLHRYDFGEVLCNVVTAVAANLGGVDALLAGRPGSWEADHVRNIVLSTAGDDAGALARYRTVPIRVSINGEMDLDEATGGTWFTTRQAREDRAMEAIDDAYGAALEANAGHQQIVSQQARDSLRDLLRQAEPDADAQRAIREAIQAEHQYLLSVSPELVAAEEAGEAISDAHDNLEKAYGAALLDAVSAEAHRRGYTVPIINDPAGIGLADLAYELMEVARTTVPVPTLPA